MNKDIVESTLAIGSRDGSGSAVDAEALVVDG